jgi:multidrug resistance efflux pump
VKEPTTLFSPGQEPKVVPYEELARQNTAVPQTGPVDRGSRAETVSYGGGLRPTSRRVAAISILAAILAATLGLMIYLVNAESANRYSAAVVPANVVELNFAVTAPLAAVYVASGDRVHRGELLASEENRGLWLEVKEQQVVISADKLRVRYLATTARPGPERARALAAEQLGLARASLAEAVLQLAIDRERLSTSQLRSPVDGVVLHVAGTPGALVGPSGVRNGPIASPELPTSNVFRLFPRASGTSTNLAAQDQPVISLVDGRRWQVVAAVPETEVASVRRGERATFTLNALGGVPVPAEVGQIVGTPFELDGQVSYEVVLRLKARLPRGVLPGMSGTVSFR